MEGSSEVWRRRPRESWGWRLGASPEGVARVSVPQGVSSWQLEAAVLGALMSRVEVLSAQMGGAGGEGSCL